MNQENLRIPGHGDHDSGTIVDQLIANPGTLITEGKLLLLFDLAETQRANEEISDVTLSRALTELRNLPAVQREKAQAEARLGRKYRSAGQRRT